MFRQPGIGRVATAFAVATALALTVFPMAAQASGNPLLFDSSCQVRYEGFAGGTHNYLFDLWTTEQPYREIYFVLDPAKVTPLGSESVGPDATIESASLLSHPGVSLWFSDDKRSVANIDNSRWLNLNLMDSYQPSQVDPLPDETYALTLRFGMNRQLTETETYRLGYWAGDMRGTREEGAPFTESDGMTVPEPGTLILLGAGLAGAAGLRRRRG